MPTHEDIIIKGARVNNLKNVSLRLPRNQFIVMTGLSGSGKSSLAFDTLYAEGQRRYVESLSSYARQFLGRMRKPECDFIQGIPPAIAIEQKVISRNPRSTVGTSTEIYDYLRLLYARIGKTYSPVSGSLVKKNTVEDVVKCVLTYPMGTRFTVLAPLKEQFTLSFLEKLLKMGFSRVEVDGQACQIADLLIEETGKASLLHNDSVCYLLIDRLVVADDKQAASRLQDSVETAFFEGDGTCLLRFYGTDHNSHVHTFSIRFEADGIRFEDCSEQTFNFNSPAGACPQCEGMGNILGIDERLVVPNSALSVYEGCVACWRGEKMGEWLSYFIRESARFNFPLFKPYYELTQAEKELLWHGTEGLEGIDSFFRMLQENLYKIQYRVMLARYRGKTTCSVCHGSRLKPEANYVKIGGKTLSELVEMPVHALQDFFEQLTLEEHDSQVAHRLLTEIGARVKYLIEVGLGYLTLNRCSNTLSGGESQRINLATSLGSALVGSLYILDEPSIGLHPRDTQALIRVLRRLQTLGNTVLVVEHDPDIMHAADYLVDVGPEAGTLGGEIVYEGAVSQLFKEGLSTASAKKKGRTSKGRKAQGTEAENSELTADEQVVQKGMQTTKSHTVRYLLGQEGIAIPSSRRAWNRSIEVVGARENNLKGITARFPLNVMTCVTGVSGSGKSTLVRDIFYRALKRTYGETSLRPGEHIEIRGDIQSANDIELIDQNPIGKSSRSNPVTYLKAYDELRHLMAEQPLSKQMQYTPSHFSFNTDGGRCEECKGEGSITIQMQFMADLTLPCEACNGTRFKKEIREVCFHGRNISDMLRMTIDEAIEFFTSHAEYRIAARLKPLADVGLGYVQLGQSSSTLSGGESQRVKLAYYLAQEKPASTIFVFDEPTTGLHAHDIRRLLSAFDALIERGHTIVVIEHNLDMIKCADHIIDLGPEGGDGGGQLLFQGTPEELCAGVEISASENHVSVHTAGHVFVHTEESSVYTEESSVYTESHTAHFLAPILAKT